jgi:hypothetical protein
MLRVWRAIASRYLIFPASDPPRGYATDRKVQKPCSDRRSTGWQPQLAPGFLLALSGRLVRRYRGASRLQARKKKSPERASFTFPRHLRSLVQRVLSYTVQ